MTLSKILRSICNEVFARFPFNIRLRRTVRLISIHLDFCLIGTIYCTHKEVDMDAITYSDLRRNLKTYMDKVYNDYEPLIISRKNSENVVLLSIHEYNSLIETDYLLRNEANAAHLKKSIEQHKAGKIQKHELL